MSWLRRKSKPREPQARAAASPSSAPASRAQATPRGQAERLETTHPVFGLKAGMGKDAVVGLLGEDYLSVNSGQVRAYLAERSSVHIRDEIDNASVPEECWLYSNSPRGHDIEIVFRSGSLTSVKVKGKNADGGTTLLVRIDQRGLAAAEPYRSALGTAKL